MFSFIAYSLLMRFVDFPFTVLMEAITPFLVSLYHKIAGSTRGFEANHAARRVYHPQLVAVYHQCGALYIIKPQERCTLVRDEIQPHRG